MQSTSPAKPKTTLKAKITLVIIGVVFSFVLLEAGLRIGGFVLLSLQDYRNRQSIQQKGAYRIMCLGESTTQGQYPAFLEEVLNQRNTGMKFSVIDRGLIGTTTLAILERLTFDLDKYHPDMVVTMMGVNDQGARFIYEAATPSKALFFLRSFRTYKLARLLWLHIQAKAGESILTEDSFKKAIELNPQDLEAYLELGRFYQHRGESLRAEDTFKKVIEPNPKNGHAYVSLGRFYLEEGKIFQAEEAFKKAVELFPKNDHIYSSLCRFYQDQSKISEPGDSLIKSMEANCDKNYIYAALSALYLEMDKPEMAEEHAKKANRGRLRNYNHITVNNYRKLKEILDKRGIKLVCVQYPMRSIALLKKRFEDNERGIIFVDNEQIFKDAVRKEGGMVYFIDMFAGDFGHCTEKGNRLLAGNIASVILKEVFNK